jgi:hypothetical protein
MEKNFNRSALVEYNNKITSVHLRKESKALTMKEDLSLYLLDEDSVTLQFSFAFLRAMPLNKVFIEKIDQMISSGIVQKNLNDHNSERKHSKLNEERTPQILTMDHFGVCFAAVLICLGLAGVVFFVEHLFKVFVQC